MTPYKVRRNRAKATAWIHASVLGVLLAPSIAMAQNTTAHAVTVRAFGGPGAFSNADADAAFTAADNIIRIDDDRTGPVDINCTHGLGRQGNVQALVVSSFDGTIRNSTQLNAVFNAPGFVKVVTAINVCSNEEVFSGGAGSIEGCARLGGKNGFIVANGPSRAPNRRGIVWAHEYVHSVGRDHRSGPALALMDALVPGSTINGAECTAIKTDNLDGDGPGGLPPATAAAPSPSSGVMMVAAPIDFVRGSVADRTHNVPIHSLSADALHWYGGTPLLSLFTGDVKPAAHAGAMDALFRIVGSGSDRATTASSARVGDLAAPSGVSYAEVEAYFSQAQPSSAEKVQSLVQMQWDRLGLPFTDSVECRGDVCRISLATSGGDATAALLRRLEVPSDVELLYKGKVVDFKEVSVAAFATKPGVRFAHALAVRD